MTREEVLEQLERSPPLLRHGKGPDEIGWNQGQEQQEDGTWVDNRLKVLELHYKGRTKLGAWRIVGAGETWDEALADVRRAAEIVAKGHAARRLL